MSTQMTDHELAERLRSALETDAPDIDLDAVVAGGGRRARRRSATRIGGGLLGAAALTGAAIGGSMLLPDSRTEAPPAATSATAPATPIPQVLKGCTLAPETCDGAVVSEWGNRHGLSAEGTFMPIRQDEVDVENALPTTGYELRAELPGLPESSASATQYRVVEVLVTRNEQDAGLWSIQRAEPGHPWQEPRQLDLLPGVNIHVNEFVTKAKDGSVDYVYSLWTVPASSRHGAVAVAFEGAPTKEWTDAAAMDLARAILTTPPAK
ncbi:hypothetical protein ACQP1U_14200 [Actinomycetota bacterium]